MADEISAAGITGLDGKAPIYQPDARWTLWALSEIYVGAEGDKKYVPKVKDYVVDTDTNEYFKVTALDPTTLIATMSRVQQVATGTLDEADLLLGVGPGTQSDTYRIYIDRSVMPHALTVDARLRIFGTAVTKAVIFKGSALQGTLIPISAMYDSGGTLLGTEVPLELCLVPNDVTNRAVKSVPTCYTTQELQDNEVVTVVFYADTGHVVSKRQLVVENTAYIRTSNSAVKYVTSIELETPFLSASDPTLIQYPINVPLNAMNLMGVVKYSDGSLKRLPVDGTKFEIFGLKNFVATIVGQQLPVVLKYNLAADEIAYGATVAADRFFVKNLTATTMDRDGIYSVKLFGYPVWIDAVNGYRLEWFLYNLDRQDAFRVTPYVQVLANTRVFDPLAYGVSQKLQVALNLKQVNASYKNYIHTQTIDIALGLAGTEHHDTAWTVGFDPGQNPPYGRLNSANMVFVNQNLRKLHLAMGETTKADWLQRLYYNAKPLVDVATESIAPEPNMFSLLFGNTEVEFTIDQWNQELVISQQLANNDTLFIKFFKRTADNDIQLAIAGVPVWQS